MDITYLGRSGIRISGKNIAVLIDPSETAKIKDEIVVLTDPKESSKLSGTGHILIDGPGEYEVKGALAVGVPALLQGSESDKPEGAVYRVEVDGFKVAVIGNLKGKLTDKQAEELSESEVLIIPVGGNGTLDPSEASEIISRLEPKYVVPVNYEKLDDFLKEMGAHPEVQPKLKLASKDLPLETTVTPLQVTA